MYTPHIIWCVSIFKRKWGKTRPTRLKAQQTHCILLVAGDGHGQCPSGQPKSTGFSIIITVSYPETREIHRVNRRFSALTNDKEPICFIISTLKSDRRRHGSAVFKVTQRKMSLSNVAQAEKFFFFCAAIPWIKEKQFPIIQWSIGTGA